MTNWQDVNKSKVKEIMGLFDLGCFQRYFRNTAHNIIDARWVIFRKMIEDDAGVKCKFAVRHVTDKFQEFETYAGTFSRSCQRIVNAVVAENEGFNFSSFDVSQAFAK